MTISNTGRLISACMIVRDEERNLKRCLDSIKDFVDEIIVVDTGSTDNTVKIAESYGAKVYHHPWQNDFSLHRNQSIGYATCKWLFIIDADEELIFDGRTSSEIKNAFGNIRDNHKALAIELKDIQSSCVTMELNTIRFFRKGCVEYKGIVHNQPSVEGASGASFIPNVRIHHYGYDLTAEQKKKKFERTVGLLEKTLKEHPENYHTLFYLCQIHTVNNDQKEANEWGEKYLVHKDKLNGSGVGNFNQSIYYTMVKNYMRMGIQKRASELLTEGLKEIPGDLDLALALTEFGVWTERPDLTSLGARQYVNAYNLFKSNPTIRKGRFVYTNYPESLAYCLYQLVFSQIDEAIKAIKDIKNVLNSTPDAYKNGMLIDLKLDLEKRDMKDLFNKLVKRDEIMSEFYESLEIMYPEKFESYQAHQ
uniref:Putative glycosyltransferase n=1 Tax=viral metagenome TaxID=1070528 RepID=A0A6M3LAQ2_9ZZZZ